MSEDEMDRETRLNWQHRALVAEAQVDAVRALHVDRNGFCGHCDKVNMWSEMSSVVPWPCPTLEAVNGMKWTCPTCGVFFEHPDADLVRQASQMHLRSVHGQAADD